LSYAKANVAHQVEVVFGFAQKDILPVFLSLFVVATELICIHLLLPVFQSKL
jgi:hypothetical protein